eukprot:3020338-Prymnesium_polylepis.1
MFRRARASRRVPSCPGAIKHQASSIIMIIGQRTLKPSPAVTHSQEPRQPPETPIQHPTSHTTARVRGRMNRAPQ